jgi:hypothetical protein
MGCDMTEVTCNDVAVSVPELGSAMKKETYNDGVAECKGSVF